MSWFAWPGIFSVLDVRDLSSAVLTCAESKEAVNQMFLCGGHHISLGDFLPG